ncbi:MAG: GAF domain-containing protein [Ardenticatenaceae bacterium]|nr:GAF domain-containing protein [Ardenticatenaceae bacterium]
MRRWLISLAVLILGLLILFELDLGAQQVQARLNDRELTTNAVALRARLETALVDRLQPIGALGAFIETRPEASQEEFDRFVSGLYDRRGPMRVVFWTDPDSQVRYLYPLFSLETLAANPPRLRDDPAIVPFIDRAVQRRARVVSDPIQTPQEVNAGRAIYVIEPAFVGERLVGFAVGVYYSDRLVRNALIGTRQDDFLVRVTDSQDDLFYGRAEFPYRSDEAPIAVANGQWHVAVGWRDPPPPIEGNTRLLLWGLGSLIIASALFTLNREITQNLRLRSRLAESQALQSTAASLVQNLSREEVLSIIADEAFGLAGVEGCAVLVAEEPPAEAKALSVAVGLGRAAPLVGYTLPVDRSVVGRAFLTGRPQVTNHPEPGEIYRGDELHVRAILAVPLSVKGQVIGAISLLNKRKGHFGAADVRLLTAFANQAATAIENARLFEAEQHRRQIADRLREATAVVSSDLALDSVLDRILDGLGTVVPYTSASVQLLEADSQHVMVIASRGFSENVVGMRFAINGSTPNTSVIRNARPLMIPDVQQEWPLFRIFSTVIRSWLGVPLVVKGQVIGMITLDRTEVDAFCEEEIGLATAFADHAAVAIEHARLFKQSEQQVRQLQALYETSLQLNLAHDLQAMFDRCIDVLERVTGVNRAALFVLDDTRSHCIIVAVHNLSQHYVDLVNTEQRLSLESGAGAATALRTGQPDLVVNAFHDERMVPWRQAARDEGYTGLAAYPLNVQGKAVGALTLYFLNETRFTPDESRLYQSFANLLALAVTNQQLLSQSRRVATLEERQRLARELHDSVTQSLFSITLTTRTVRRLLTRDPERAICTLDQLQELAQGALAEMRALIFELRPAALQQEGLVNAVRKHADATKSRHHLAVEFEHRGERRLPEGHEEALYRVVQEALNNVVKHALAQTVRIFLDLESLAVTLTISDDGSGFDPDSPTLNGMGLFTMRERVAPLGGTFAIESSPGQGTTVCVTVPVPLESPQLSRLEE